MKDMNFLDVIQVDSVGKTVKVPARMIMDFSTEAQVLNLIDRFGQGVVFEDDEEGHIISDLDEKFDDLSRRWVI